LYSVGVKVKKHSETY